MLKEIYHFVRYGPGIRKQRNELGLVEFLKINTAKIDADGFAELRKILVGDLEGDILEIGTGIGATFPYYGEKANVTAIEPHEELRIAAEEAAQNSQADIKVLPGSGEKLPVEDKSFDAVTASLVLCSVESQSETLEEFKRVLRPGGQIRLLEHVRSKNWFFGPFMNFSNSLWLRINQRGCNWNRQTIESVNNAGFKIKSVTSHKIFSKYAPTSFPLRIIKADNVD